MAKTRHWQARVSYPGGGVFIFGVRAASLPRALLKAFELAAVAGSAEHLTLTRLYGPHHPLHLTAREGRP